MDILSMASIPGFLCNPTGEISAQQLLLIAAMAVFHRRECCFIMLANKKVMELATIYYDAVCRVEMAVG